MDTPDDGWLCEAYGPRGPEIGATCFVPDRLGERTCRSPEHCAATMAEARQDVFGRIQQLSAEPGETGDVFRYLAREFTSPDQLLGGAEGPDPQE